MKSSKLVNTIKESIKKLMIEQGSQTMNANVCTCGGHGTQTTFFNPAGSTGPCMTPNNPFPSTTNTPDQQGNPQYAVGTWSGGGGAGCNSGYAFTTYFQNDPPTAHSNLEYTWFDQMHYDTNGNCIPNPIDCGPGRPPTQDHVCYDGNCLDCSNSMYTNYCNSPGATIYPDLISCQTALQSNNGQCPSTGCTQQSFDYNNPPCGHHVQQAPGGQNSWSTWLTNQWNAFNGSAGCFQFGAIINWITQQTTPTAACPTIHTVGPYDFGGEKPNGQCHNLISVKRKAGKLFWAECMMKHCRNTGGTQPGC